jgi:hypothetical protein
MFRTSFYALHIHYWTTGPIKNSGGVINFKRCTGGLIIGPILSIQPGSLHNIKYGTFTFLGDIHYNSSGFRQNIIAHPLKSIYDLDDFMNAYLLFIYHYKKYHARTGIRI